MYHKPYKNYSNKIGKSQEEKERRDRQKIPGLSYSIPKNNRYYLYGIYPEPDTYKHLLHYILMFEDENGNIVDMRVVKTVLTLEKFLKSKGKYKIHIHPNPVILRKEFWEEYRAAKNGYERVSIFKKHNILSDENIFYVDTITIDIDSRYEDSIQALEELIDILKIPMEALTIIKTKSGNLRFAFRINPVNPRKVNRKNKKTHLENIKEFVRVVNEFFISKCLKADKTFERINHPVILNANQEVIQDAELVVGFYQLYKEAKKLKKQLPKQKQKIKKVKDRIKLPAFVMNKLQNLENKTSLEKAVDTLYKNNRHKGTYIHFLQPIAGWCKYLSMSYQEYYDLVYPYLTSRSKNKERDIKTAWEYADTLEFKGKTTKKEYSFRSMAEKLLKYLEVNGDTDRQTLLKEVFYNQKWLLDLIVKELESAGIIESRYEKQQGKGRPRKIISLSSQILENKEKSSFSDFSQYNNKESFSFNLVVVGNTFHEPEKEKEKEEKEKEVEKGKPEKKEKGKLERISDEGFERDCEQKSDKNLEKNSKKSCGARFEDTTQDIQNNQKAAQDIQDNPEAANMKKFVSELVRERDKTVALVDSHIQSRKIKLNKQKLKSLQDLFYRKFENDVKNMAVDGWKTYFNWLKIFKHIQHDIVKFVDNLGNST